MSRKMVILRLFLALSMAAGMSPQLLAAASQGQSRKTGPPRAEPPVAMSFEVGPTGAALSVSADGSLVAVGDKGRVEIRSSLTGKIVGEIQDRFQPLFTNSGSFLVTRRGRQFDFHSIGSWGQPKLVLRLDSVDSATFPTSVAVSPDDRTMWVGMQRLEKSEGEDWIVRCSIPVDQSSVSCPAAASDGIAVPDSVSALELSPDGKLLAISYGLQVDLRDAETWELIFGLTAEKNAAASTTTALSFSPDGRFLVCSMYKGVPLVWDLETQGLIRLRPIENGYFHSSYPCRKAEFSTDGRYLFGVDGRALTIWRAANWKPLTVMERDRAAYPCLSLSQNGETAVLLTSAPSREEPGRPLLKSSVLVYRVDDLIAFDKPK